ncbi:hypothetical protein JTB14_019570 [Gonioctena quinquepunctata]|nr:hypothetical protein JTB14_019570 [Gonioctena quinquepunctata]
MVSQPHRILGNEQADKAAQDACSAPPDGIPIRSQDLKNYIKHNSINVWQSQWNEQTQKLRSDKPTVEKWQFPINITRREQVPITRLRTRHTNLTRSYLMTNSDQPLCEIFQVPLTVKHIIESCVTYYRFRNQIGININLNLALSNDPKSTVNIAKNLNSYGITFRVQ